MADAPSALTSDGIHWRRSAELGAVVSKTVITPAIARMPIAVRTHCEKRV